jgi:hypothetical protein
VPELQRLRADHAAAVLAFERTNRAYFAAAISDRGDERHGALLAEQEAGWNRFSLVVPDLAAAVEELRSAGVHFRNEIVTGVGGNQILLDDPSGNPVELFEPTRAEAKLSGLGSRSE